MPRLSAVEVKQVHSKQPVILLIENDEADVFLFRRALAKTGYVGDLRVVGSATEARAYIENTHPFKDPLYFRQPKLIVSDFRLAGHTALEFLTWLRFQPAIAHIPIVMLSGVASGFNAVQLAKIDPKAFILKTGDVAALAASLEPLLPQPTA
jgi:CheY-like chemotaxis protein